MKTFAGKTVLITGVTRGLGATLTRQLLKEGAQVIGVARSTQGLEALKQEAEQQGCGKQLRLFSADVSEPGTISSAILTMGTSASDIDIVIANAGVKVRSDALIDLASIRRTFDTNLFGTLETVNAVLPAMIQRGSGHIVFISSLGRLHGMKSAQGYNASKAAVSNLADSLRIDLAARRVRGVQVTVVEPGLIRTDMIPKHGLQKLLSMECGKAASRIITGIRKQKSLVTFPITMVILGRILAYMPPRFRAAVLAKLIMTDGSVEQGKLDT